MDYQESLLRDTEALEMASLINNSGLAFRYVGGFCFELRSRRSMLQAFDILSQKYPDYSFKGFRLSDGETPKYFIEVK